MVPSNNATTLELFKTQLDPETNKVSGIPHMPKTNKYGFTLHSFLVDVISRVSPSAPTSFKEALSHNALVALLPGADLNAADSKLAISDPTAAKAAYGDETFSCTRGAPTVIVVSVQEVDGQIAPNMIASAGCVVQNMHLAATDLGLGSVYLGSIQAVSNSFEVLYKLKLQDGFWPVAALAVGNAKEPAEKRDVPMTKIFTNIVE
jgi:hypothetical protein